MKILMINVVCGIGSTGRICTDIAEEMCRQGHDVKIAYGRGDVPTTYKKISHRIGTDFDVYTHAAKSRLFDSAGFESKRVTSRFIDWIEDYNPDIIHIHNLHGYYINIEILFSYLKKSKKRIIWTLHDSWAFTGHTPYCDSINCNRWMDGCYKCPLINEYPKSLIDKSSKNWEKKRKIFTNTSYMTIVTPSNWLSDCVKKSFLRSYPIVTINNGIDTKIFCPTVSNFKSKYSIEDKIMLLGVASQWDKNKGLNDYIYLSKIMSDEYQIVLVGLSNKQIESIDERIIGIERTNSIEELAGIYAAADIYLNLSYCENYPTVNIEAMACGTPVIASDIPGCRETFIDGVSGLAVKVKDSNDLISKIEQFINLPYETKKRMGKANREHVVKNFDRKIVVEKYIEIIEKYAK